LKKYIRNSILFILLLASLYGVGRLIDVSYGSYQFVERQPYLLMQTQNSITLKWQTPQEEFSNVAYGLTPQNLNHVLMGDKLEKKHKVVIPKLHECTKYFYSVSSESMSIDNSGRSFTTLCKNADSQRVWVIGDSGEKGENQKKVYAQMLQYINNNFNALSMWILLGDNAYRSGTQKQYNETLFEPYIELVKRFVPWAIIGNHDNRRWAFDEIWDFPAQGESGGVRSRSENYYSIDNGNLHLVMLDSERVDRSSDGAMAAWLREDLKANTKPWVVVTFHSPAYTDGGHKSDNFYDSMGRMTQMRENFVPIFDAFGVDLVLSGHSHGYERSKLMVAHVGKSITFNAQKHLVQDNRSCYTKPLQASSNSGTLYQLCGSSSKLDQATLKHPAMPFAFETMGSIILEITPTTLTSKFLTIEGKIADEFIIRKDNISCKEESK